MRFSKICPSAKYMEQVRKTRTKAILQIIENSTIKNIWADDGDW